MNELKRTGLLILLLTKRLYKKVSFGIILAVLIVITAFMCLGFKQENSMLKIGIIRAEDSVKAEKMVDSLISTEGAVSYKSYSHDTAYSMLKNGKLDAVWEFTEDFDSKLEDFIQEKRARSPITVTIREQNVFINLTLERLYAEVFPAVSENFYREYASEEIRDAKDSELSYYYENVFRSNGIVKFSYYNDDSSVEESNYLVSPLRGILAVLVVLCGLASALYFSHDKERGCMDAITLNKRPVLNLCYIFTGSANIAVFAIIALLISGLWVNAFAEMVAMLLFIAATVGFAALLSCIFRRTVRIASLMPVVMLAMLVVCPIFLNTHIKFVSWLFPAYWYLVSVYNMSEIPKMLLYTVVVYLLYFLLSRRKAYL